MEQGVVDLLRNSINFWNVFFSDILTLIQTSPDSYGGGTVWNLITQINTGIRGIAYGLLVLFFLLSFFKTTTNVRELSFQQIIGWVIRFILVKFLIDYSINLMNFFISISLGVNSTILQSSGEFTLATVPQALIDSANNLSNANIGERIWGALDSIPLFLFAAIGCGVIFIAGAIMVVVVYLRFFRLFIYSAISPIPLSTFGSPETSNTGKHFIKAYAAVCLEICVIALACVIFNAIMSSSMVMFPSWETMGGTPSKDFFGTALNFILTEALQVVMLAVVIVSSNKFIKEILGV